jgi:serine/threonine-protein kinase
VGAVPEGFDAWFAKACAREPEHRFQTIQELAKSLSLLLSPGQAWLADTDSGVATGRVSQAPSVTPADSARSDGVDRGDLASADTELASSDAKLASATGGAHSLSSAPDARPRPRWVAAAGVVLGLGAVSTGVYLTTREPHEGARADAASSTTTPSGGPIDEPLRATAAPPAPAAPSAPAQGEIPPAASQLTSTSTSAKAPASKVTITFESEPAGAEVVLGDVVLGRAPGPIELDQGATELSLSVRKYGYRAREVKLTPDRPQTKKVVLERSSQPSDGLL